METTTRFEMNGGRYKYDFGACSPKKGFAQVDTSQDAWYYGNWANPETLELVSYAEGDLTIKQADTEAEFVEEMRRIEKWHKENGGKCKVDTMCVDTITLQFEQIGLADMLH